MTEQNQQYERGATAIEHGRFVTDGGEDIDGPETFGHLTLLEATNADTQIIMPGIETADTHEVAEVHDSYPVYARRYYEPVDTLELPDELDTDEIGEWVESNRNHPDLFANFDWEEYHRRLLLETIVNNRNSFRGFLSHIERELAEVRTVGTETTEQLDEIQEEIVDSMMDGPAVTVNCVEQPDETDEGEGVAV
jgi:hypothetical protein